MISKQRKAKEAKARMMKATLARCLTFAVGGQVDCGPGCATTC